LAVNSYYLAIIAIMGFNKVSLN